MHWWLYSACVSAFILLTHVKCMHMHTQAPFTHSVPPSTTPTYTHIEVYLENPVPMAGSQAKPWAPSLQLVQIALCYAYFQFMKQLIVLNYSCISTYYLVACVCMTCVYERERERERERKRMCACRCVWVCVLV